jgi:hypothetical protein
VRKKVYLLVLEQGKVGRKGSCVENLSSYGLLGLLGIESRVAKKGGR